MKPNSRVSLTASQAGENSQTNDPEHGRTLTEYRQDNKEKIREKDKEYRENNREIINEKKKEFRKEHKEEIKE
jgi:hypothetical protein